MTAAPTAHADTAALPPAPEAAQLEVGLMQNLCTLLWCPRTRAAALVDPAWEPDRLLRWAAERALRIERVLVTHTHHDHVEAVPEVVRRTGARVHVHPHERARVTGLLEAAGVAAVVEDVRDRQDLRLGDCGVRALETFGHTAGGVTYLGDGFAVTGDVLFVGGCGRTDLPGGDTRRLWASLQRLAALPEETVVYPGHDYGSTATSTIGRELLENPYLRCATFEDFRALRERRRPAPVSG